MDRNPYAILGDRENIAGIAIIYYLGDWFGSALIFPGLIPL
jgi:hypothetical protein